MLLHGPEVLRAIRSKAEKTNQLKNLKWILGVHLFFLSFQRIVRLYDVFEIGQHS